MNLNKSFFELPSINTISETNFWNEEYISKELLTAHLDCNSDGASRKKDFIDNSVAWISQITPSEKFPILLDVGCGPGLYTERFYQHGYEVTGIDISQNSIDYARNSALEKGFNIQYECQDYLKMQLTNKYDLATMIYCDYGALSSYNRQMLMKKIYDCLNQGGVFLLDVFSIEKYAKFKNEQSWEFCQHNGFWDKNPYLLLNTNFKYENFTTLERAIVITEENTKTYYIWNKCFTKKSLIDEAKEAGFKVKDIFSDVTGSPYADDSETIAILFVK
ncbi:class I SAM-dependent methyltransferase [Petroclostridium sp. X23]|uniref:class I SAM-dependent methyltransferase n=1 Tax=Petroclostridium sp. X23 TaxID=3045146 RepID=UPI0024AE8638|nr:class I SAM-dependent methyltransferase [Petroclostridium sp. X23]WHH57747.1 class I SAM-dependent methyltransferase [Petroclostridium sp. X23]